MANSGEGGIPRKDRRTQMKEGTEEVIKEECKMKKRNERTNEKMKRGREEGSKYGRNVPE
jgi:hypothetical protein